MIRGIGAGTVATGLHRIMLRGRVGRHLTYVTNVRRRKIEVSVEDK